MLMSVKACCDRIEQLKPVVAAADFQGLIAPPYFEPDSEGMVHLPEAPGLGVEINESHLQELQS